MAPGVGFGHLDVASRWYIDRRGTDCRVTGAPACRNASLLTTHSEELLRDYEGGPGARRSYPLDLAISFDSLQSCGHVSQLGTSLRRSTSTLQPRFQGLKAIWISCSCITE